MFEIQDLIARLDTYIMKERLNIYMFDNFKKCIFDIKFYKKHNIKTTSIYNNKSLNKFTNSVKSISSL